MAAGQVVTDRIGPARLFQTFVDIDASGSLRFETVAAETLAVQALGVVNAIEIAFAVGCHVHLRDHHSIGIRTNSH